jgi:hypothetical protein
LAAKISLINDELVFANPANKQISFLIYRQSYLGYCNF